MLQWYSVHLRNPSYSICVNKYQQQSCWLSFCEVWYGSNLEILPFLFKVLEEFVLIKIQNHIITYSSIGEQFLPKPNMISCKFQAFHICCLLLYWVWSSLVDPWWEIYHAPKIKIMYTSHTHAAPVLGYAQTCFHLDPQKILLLHWE